MKILTIILVLSSVVILSAQIRTDSSGTSVVIHRDLFKGIINKINERNFFQAENTELMRELETEQIMNEYKDRHISLLKSELVKALSVECEKPAWFDNFAIGAAFTGLVALIALIVGISL
jgi:hypothetical protein